MADYTNWEGSGIIGTDTSISFGTSGFVCELLDISPPSAEAKEIEMTHMKSVDYKEYLPGKIIEWGACELEIAFLPDQSVPIGGDPETITITFPGDIANPTGWTWAFSGWVSEYSPKAPLEDRMTATVKVQCAGDITGFVMYDQA